MSRLTETRPQRLKIAETQMEMRADSSSSQSPLSEDFEGKLQAAQLELEKLRQQQEFIERQKQELQELNERKEEFIHGQNDISDRLASALTAIDRELFEMRQEMEDLEQTRQCFAEHQKKIDEISPANWTREELKNQLDRAISMLDHAEDEYEEAMQHFAGGNRAGVFSSKKKKNSLGTTSPSEFGSMLKQGMAFNLPIIVLGLLALIAYWMK